LFGKLLSTSFPPFDIESPCGVRLPSYGKSDPLLLGLCSSRFDFMGTMSYRRWQLSTCTYLDGTLYFGVFFFCRKLFAVTLIEVLVLPSLPFFSFFGRDSFLFLFSYGSTLVYVSFVYTPGVGNSSPCVLSGVLRWS